MSWLKDLAGQAEGLLNQLDATAADALVKPGGPGGRSTPANSSISGAGGIGGVAIDSIPISSVVQHSSPPSTTATYANSANTPRRDRSSGYASSLSSQRTREREDEDQDKKLLEYLNEDAKSERTGGGGGHSRRSSSSSIFSLPSFLTKPPTAGGQNTNVVEPQPSSPHTVLQMSDYQQQDAVTSSGLSAGSTKGDMVRGARLEREIIELKAREIDLNKAIQAKDSQLAVLRVRLQESDSQLQSKAATLASLKSEKERLLRDSADSSHVRDKALTTLQQQLKDTEEELERERNIGKRAEKEYQARVEQLMNESSELAKQVTNIQKSHTDHKISSKEKDEQLRLAKFNLEANKQEFDEYKQKAQRILQSKEKLIETLKEGGGAVSGSEGELEELRAERDLLNEDVQQAQSQIYNLKAEMQELESQLASQARADLESVREAQEQCQGYQQTASHYQEELESLKREYQILQEELRRQQISVQSKLQEKDAEIYRLMNQTTVKNLNQTNVSEFEDRIRGLTENLIAKQTSIETLQTEKNSLSLQLERVDRMYKEAEAAAIRSSGNGGGGADDGGMMFGGSFGSGGGTGGMSRVPAFLRETPYDNGIARGVKKAYGALDSVRLLVSSSAPKRMVACLDPMLRERFRNLSCGWTKMFHLVVKVSTRFSDVESGKAGLFLRRWPIAQNMIMIYMILLQLYVMLVLLTYTPEIHPHDYHPKPPSAPSDHDPINSP